MRALHILLLITLIPIPSSIAEYRAFELLIEDTQTGAQRTVVSTMDHLQYSTYYPLNKNETVRYVRSWMYWGTTDYHQSICNEPERNVANQRPVSAEKNAAPNLTQ